MAKSLSFVLKTSKVSSSFPALGQTFPKVPLQQKGFTSKACSYAQFLSHLCASAAHVAIHWAHYSGTDNRFVEHNRISEMRSLKTLPSPKKYQKSQNNQTKPNCFIVTQHCPRNTPTTAKWKNREPQHQVGTSSQNTQNYLKLFQPCQM